MSSHNEAPPSVHFHTLVIEFECLIQKRKSINHYGIGAPSIFVTLLHGMVCRLYSGKQFLESMWTYNQLLTYSQLDSCKHISVQFETQNEIMSLKMLSAKCAPFCLRSNLIKLLDIKGWTKWLYICRWHVKMHFLLKIFVFWLKFHCLLLRVQLMISEHWLR